MYSISESEKTAERYSRIDLPSHAKSAKTPMHLCSNTEGDHRTCIYQAFANSESERETDRDGDGQRKKTRTDCGDTAQQGAMQDSRGA